MKNFKKLLPLFALVLGLGLVFTQSAFKSTVDERYGYDATYGWINIDNLEPGASYDCNMPEPTLDICTQKYTDHPEASGSLPVEGDEEFGEFIYTPAPSK